MNLGMAFQLIDDVLDCTSTEDALGKPAGADLLEGKLSLPLILLLERQPELRLPIQTIISEGSYRSISRQTLLDALVALIYRSIRLISGDFFLAFWFLERDIARPELLWILMQHSYRYSTGFKSG